MMKNETDEVTKKAFDSLKSRHQNSLESMKGSEFIFDYIHLLYNKSHKINPNHDGSYIDSANGIESSITVTVSLNRQEIKKDPQRTKIIKPVINQNNWEGINFSSEKKD